MAGFHCMACLRSLTSRIGGIATAATSNFPYEKIVSSGRGRGNSPTSAPQPPICTFNAGLLFGNITIRSRNTSNSKHKNPKFRQMRAWKVIKVDLPNFHEDIDDMTPDEIRSKMKEKGIVPARPWIERPMTIGCTGAVFEPYVPPEGDGKISVLTKEGAKQKYEFLAKKGKSYMALRKIRTLEEDFDVRDFADMAQEIYIKTHAALAEKNVDKLHEFVTEKAYPMLTWNVKGKTMRWSFIKSLEPPRTVQLRCVDVISKSNLFAQITVRFHTQQTLAIYDRFGRLMHGSEVVAKDVLEYVVFEKHLVDMYGIWRIHDKVVPEWMPKREPVLRTYVKPSPPEPDPEEEEEESAAEGGNKEKEMAAVEKNVGQTSLPVATA